jgi:O-antigen biosynthesis rhamnosyltransferase
MRVLHFYKDAYPESVGGVEQVIHQLASGAAHLGVETDVLSLTQARKASVQSMDGYTLHRVPMGFSVASMGVSFAAISAFKKLAVNADVIHYHFPWPFMDLVHCFARVKKPTVVTYHSDIVRQQWLLKLYRPLKRLFLRKVDAIVATSPNYAASSQVLAAYADKLSVIPIGLDKAAVAVPSQTVLDKWSAKLGGRFFLFVGVLRYYKGLHVLLEAAQGTDLPIVIVGAGPLEDALKKQASALGLHHVHFLGAVSEIDKAALMYLCHAFVFPSHLRSEAFGIALLEAAMFGKPMISCEIGTGTTFINIANQTGLVVPPNDAAALRSAMQYLSHHPAQAAEMGALAAKRYQALFTTDKMVEAYVALYRKLLVTTSLTSV